MNKIGMCCACGGSFSTSRTILIGPFEYCPTCADMLGYDEDDDETEFLLADEEAEKARESERE